MYTTEASLDAISDDPGIHDCTHDRTERNDAASTSNARSTAKVASKKTSKKGGRAHKSPIEAEDSEAPPKKKVSFSGLMCWSYSVLFHAASEWLT